MKKQFVFIVLLSILCFASQAQDPDDLEASVKLVVRSLETVNDLTLLQPPCDIPVNPPIALGKEFSRKGVGDLCNKFLGDFGEVGEWGQVILNTFDTFPPDELHNSFFSDNIPDMPFICPRFSEFSDELKKKFWVWSFAAIAWEESSCKPKASVPGVNSRAVGLLQLEDSRRLRSDRGKHCDVKNIISPPNNLACGVEIMHQQLLGSKSKYFNTSTGEMFWKSSYWLHMRLKSKNLDATKKRLTKSIASESDKKPSIKTLVMRFPFCR